MSVSSLRPFSASRVLLSALRLLPLVACLALTVGVFAQDAPDLAGQASPPAIGSGAAPTGTAAPAQRPAGGDSMLFYLLPGILVIWIVMMVMGQRRDAKKKTSMLESLKKHDRVQTVGGVIGSVVEVKPSTVVLKVDEGSNTRITFAKSSVVGVLKDESEPVKERPS